MFKDKRRNMDDETGTESTSNMNPMQMEEILKILFDVMDDVPSLKSSREVSPLWNREATRVIFSKGFFRVPPKFHVNYSKPTDEIQKEKKTEIKLIRKFLDTHRLTVEKIKIADEKDVPIFRSISRDLLGENVKSLKLCYGNVETQKNLIQSLKNLKSLDHLTTYPFMAFSRDNFKRLISFQKPLTISYLEFSPVDRFHSKEFLDQSIDMYEQFLREKMTTRSIQTQLHEALEYNYNYDSSNISVQEQRKRDKVTSETLPMITTMLFKMLQASTNTLEQFVMWDPLGLLCDLKIPQLPKVKKLVVRIRFCDNKYYGGKEETIRGLLTDGLLFPPGFKFMDIFPNLETVQLSAFSVMKGEMKLMELWAQSMASAGIAEKVKTVVVEDDNFGSTRNSLKTNFPNME